MTEFVRRLSKKISKLSVEQLESVFADLCAENDLLTSVFDSSGTGMLIVDTEWSLVRANRAAERFLCMAGQARGDERHHVWELVPDGEIGAFLRGCCAERRSNVSGEFTLATDGGAVRFLSLTVLPVVSEGAMTGFIISAEDVTQKRRQEIQLRRMENMAGLTTLAASMAHDIKNPLGAMGIQLQLVQKVVASARQSGALPLPKFLEEKLCIIGEEISHLSRIVTDFQFAAKPVQSVLELVNMDKLLAEFTDFFVPELESKHIALERHAASAEPVLLLADKKLVREMTGHFLQNAMYAIEQRREDSALPEFEGRISVESSVSDGRYTVRFCDNGCGMDSDTAARIFEPYFSTKSSGTGLGMTMVYKIIKEFSGDISVDSAPNKGTCFRITLPLPQTETLRLK